MSNVLIEKQKLDVLATAISNKSGEPLKLTLDEMVEAVDGIETGGGTPSLQNKSVSFTPTETAQSQTVTADSGYDGLGRVTASVGAIDSEYVGSDIPRRSSTDLTSDFGTVTAPAGYYESAATKTLPSAEINASEDIGFYTTDGTRKWKTDHSVSCTSSGYLTAQSIADYYHTYNAVPANTTITPSTTAQTVGGANYMMEGAVTVSAMPSGDLVQTVTGSVTPTISVSNTGLIEVSGTGYTQNVSPVYQSGYIDSSATLTVTASAGNTYQLDTQAAKTVTPSTSAQTAVAAGKYTTGAVTVAAMPSGTAGTPTATKGTVSNHSVSVTPSVTNTTGYITGSTKTGTAVTVSASELVSGSETKTANGTYNVTNLASLVVAVPIVTYYTGSSSPSSSTGSDGDIYLQTS